MTGALIGLSANLAVYLLCFAANRQRVNKAPGWIEIVLRVFMWLNALMIFVNIVRVFYFIFAGGL